MRKRVVHYQLGSGFVIPCMPEERFTIEYDTSNKTEEVTCRKCLRKLERRSF